MGHQLQVHPCNEKPCPIDCHWGSWTQWTQCTKTGRKRRRRRDAEAEADPAPQHHGHPVHPPPEHHAPVSYRDATPATDYIVEDCIIYSILKAHYASSTQS